MRGFVVIAMLLGGCGSSSINWNGTYAGVAPFTNMCSDASRPAMSTPEVVLTLTQSGSTLTGSGLGCDFTADINGDQALIRMGTCPTNASNNTLGYSGGTLTIGSGGSLVIGIYTSDLLHADTSSPVGCTGTMSSQLTLVSGTPPESTWNPYP